MRNIDQHLTETKMTKTLCLVQDIDESTAKGFSIDESALFAVKHDGQIYVYENSCPHIGINLEFQENQFLDMDKRFIQCSNHNALFEIESGHCISGPCQGKSLKAIPFEIENDRILVKNIGWYHG